MNARVALPTVVAVLVAFMTIALVAQQPEIHVLPLRGNVYLLVGAGSNITVSIGKEGVLLVDAGTAAAADAVVAAVSTLSRELNGPAAARPCAGLGCAGNEFASFLGT